MAVAGAALLAAVQGQPPGDVSADGVPPNDRPASPVEDVDVSEPDDPRAGDGGADAAEAGTDTAGRAGDGDHEPGAAITSAGDVAASPLLGRVDGLILHLPATDAVVIGFHEASSSSFGIEPIGRLVDNHNTTRFEPILDTDEGVDYVIMSSRGRVHPPTSAVDVLLEDDVPVLAPVTGVVADVREYHLYGRHQDHRIEIHPDAAPHLRVVIVHVADVMVREGDRVVAGVTMMAGTANRFPFSSQIDRESEPDRWPHVHIEVQPIDAPRPGDDAEEESEGE